jgi:ATP-dependent Lon protease
VIEKLQELQNLTTIDKPYLLHLVDLDIPNEYKACALRKINIMRSMGGGFGNSEFYKIKSWVDAFLKIPFNKYNNLPISFADGIEKCHDFMEYTKKTLDSVVYGLEDAKIQIMQMVGLWLVNPNAIGCAIAIKGPPGTGKTTLIKEGISKILNRPFALVALGGCGDAGFLDGFDYTYEGSKYGKIIDILIQCGCMNPVILFDELDKLSDSYKGQEVTGVLTHLTDSTQNTKFSDKYFSEISINMSKALFIFSYNDENAVNNVLKDRMYKIETKGYKTKEKLIIAKEHLLPKIRDEIKFDMSTVVFNDELLEYIINDFTEKEDGVRNLKRCLEIIYKKLNLYRLMKPDINLFENSEGLKLKTKLCFPCILTREIIDDLIKKESTDNIPYGMYN